MRERSTGSTFGVRCTAKGAQDGWMVENLVSKIQDWGLGEFCLWVKSDGEPAIKSVQKAVRDARPVGTHLLNSPPYGSQGTGVAARAVKEYVNVLRRIKLGLESRTGCHIDDDSAAIDKMTEHVGFVISR